MKQVFSILLALTMLWWAGVAVAAETEFNGAEVQTTGAGLVSKVAPGEFLPIAIKLLNFGSSKRVDVSVSYKITDAEGSIIYSADETMAVETTASFVRTIQIPFETPPGKYFVRSSIAYQDQKVPAVTNFPFIVERKIIGLFASEFYLYGGATLVVSLAGGLIGHAWIRRRRASRVAPIEYLSVPREKRIFYELISDTIAQMRQHAGDSALDIAKGIERLVIDESTGRVLAIKSDPAKIMASLISRYEQLLGQKVSFALRRGAGGVSQPALYSDKNLVVINK